MIKIEIGPSTKHGACTACDKFITSEGVKPHKVFNIHIIRPSSSGSTGQSFRLCDDCKDELIEELEKIEEV